MSTSINTNISALAAQSSLRKTGLAQDTAVERLSTGIRINNAKDDAAGLAISTRMTANIRGISAAIRNANDGISLTQTAEGSLTAIGDNLQRVRELAVQSSNTGNSTSDRAAMNAEASQLIAEIDRVANNSAFNGIKLLDGSFQNQTLQVGAGNDSNDRISISIGSAKANALGVGGGSSYSTTLAGLQVGSSALAANSLSINGFMVGNAGNDGVSFAYGDTSGISVATAINSVSGQTGVSASVSATKTNTVVPNTTGTVLTASTAVNAGDVTINGVDIGQLTGNASVAVAGDSVAAAINAVSARTGVTATNTAGRISLTASDGRDIVVGGASSTTTAQTSLTKGTYTAGSKLGATLAGGSMTPHATTSSVAASSFLINNVAIGAIASSATAATYSTNAATAINAVSEQTGVTATINSSNGRITLASKNGADIVLKGVDAAAVTQIGLIGLTATTTGTSTAYTTSAALGDDTVRINGVNIGAIEVANSKGERGSQMASAINAKTSQTGVEASFNKDTGAVLLSAKDGRNIIISVDGKADAPITSSITGLTHSDGGQTVGTRVETVLRSTVSLTSNGSSGITVAGNTAAGLTATGFKAGATAATATQGAGVSAVNLSTASGAQAALTVLDSAINTVTDFRAAMGAYQNRMTAAISNLEVTSMNLQASRSRILDTDYAKETTNLAKTQIITQAATAMLAQANQSAQSVLALLK